MARLNIFTRVNWCKTQIDTITIPFEWTIENFSFHLRQPGYSLKSSTFSSGPQDNTEWFLEMFPKGYNKEAEDYISVGIHAVLQGENAVYAKLKVAIINNKHRHVDKEWQTEVLRFDGKFNGCRWLKVFKLADLLNESNGLISNDTVVLKSEITVLIDTFTQSGNASNKRIPQCNLKTDLFQLFEKEVLTDVILSANNGKQFKVHKTILAARSSVFSTMFTTEMKEKNEGIIEINDVDEDVLYHMLHYIYTGNVGEMKTVKLTVDLLAAADKYDLERLKALCEDNLCTNLTIENASDLFVVSDFYRVSQLKETAMDFIYCRFADVSKTRNWISLKLTHPQLLNEMLEYVVLHDQDKIDVNCI